MNVIFFVIGFLLMSISSAYAMEKRITTQPFIAENDVADELNNYPKEVTEPFELDGKDGENGQDGQNGKRGICGRNGGRGGNGGDNFYGNGGNGGNGGDAD